MSYFKNYIILILGFFSLLLIASCNELDPGEFSILDIRDNQVSNSEAFMAFNVRLSEASEHKVKVDYSTFDQSAKAGEHYSDTSGTLVFEPGETEQRIHVKLLNATFNSPHRKFRVKLENPTGADIHNRRKQATGSILNSGTELIIHNAEATVKDNTIRFIVSYYGSADEQISVNYSTSDQSAKAGKHFVETSGTLTFDSGQTEQFINVELLGSSFNAPQRRFRMRLDNPVGAELHNRNRQATGIIFNEKDGISFDISDVEATVGDDEISFSVTLSEAPDDEVSVDFVTRDQSAKAGEDYVETTGTLTFEAGQTEQLITVELLGATFNSQGRKFRLELDNAVGAILENNNRNAIGTILNSKKDQVNLLISDAEAVLGDETMNFPVTLSDPAEGEIKVDFKIFGQSAKAGEDYVDVIGTLTFEEGEIEKIITVDLLGTDFSSPVRKFRMKLDNSVGAELKNSNKQATGTIKK